MNSALLSSNYIRTEQTHTLFVTFAPGTMSDGNRVFVEFPIFYNEMLSLKTEKSIYPKKSTISCIINRLDDILSKNFAQSCTVLSGSVIRILLATDLSNNFEKQYQI